MHNPHVFISYSRNDQSFLDELLPALKAEKIDFWTDREIQAGSDWMAEIETAMSDAEVFLVCLTPNYVKSDWTMFETGMLLSRAKQSNAEVVPVLLKGSKVPAFLNNYHSLDATRSSSSEIAKQVKGILQRNNVARRGRRSS